MKLGTKDISAFLSAPDRQAGAVLLYGPDQGLIRERSKFIAAIILGKNSDPINHVQLSAEQVKADPVCLRDELCALSLMAGRRLVVLRDAGDKLAAAVEGALEGLKTTTYLIVEGEELSPSSPLRKFFENAASCAALPCYHDDGRSLEETLKGALAAQGLRAAPDAMRFLLSSLGNDRGITLSEVEKIAVYLGQEKEVTLEVAMLMVGQNAAEGLEDICHLVACGRIEATEAMLGRLLHEGVQPVAIVRALLRHFQRLDIAQAQMASGASVDQAIASLRPPVFFKYAPPTRRALALWNARALMQVGNLLLKTERELKSALLSPALVAGHALQQVARMAAG